MTGAGAAEIPAGELLVAEPAAPGQLVGYGRVSTREQRLDRQTAALHKAGCERIFTDKLSGRDADRPELRACFDYARAGDLVVVTELARLGRSLSDLIALVGQLREREIGFRSLSEAIDTSTPGGRLIFHIFASLAEFVRELIVEGTQDGLAAARARGQTLGRPPALSPDQVRQARLLLARPEESVASIARLLGISRTTLYKHVPELRHDGGRAALIETVRSEALASYDARELPGQTGIELRAEEYHV